MWQGRINISIFVLFSILCCTSPAWATDRIDNFNRTGSTLGTPSDGLSAWSSSTCGSGSWTTDGTHAVVPFLEVGCQAVLESSVADVNIQVTVVSIGTPGSLGIVTREVDASNYLSADCDCSGAGDFRFIKVVSGSGSILANTGPITLNNADVLKVTANGSILTLFQNGNSILTYTLSSAEMTQFGSATLHGLRSSSSGSSTFDDFSIISIGGGGTNHNLTLMGVGQ